jgi:hypothetical protein
MSVQHPLTLAIAVLGPQHYPTGETTYYADPPDPDVRPAILRIVRYDGDIDGVYLLYCDANGDPLLDTFHESVEGAEEQARVALQVQSSEWRRRRKRVKSARELWDALVDIRVMVYGWARAQPQTVSDAEFSARLIMVGDDLAAAIPWDRKLVSTSVVGMSWHLFTELLQEAQFAADPDKVWNTAWRWQERLEWIFGPRIAG